MDRSETGKRRSFSRYRVYKLFFFLMLIGGLFSCHVARYVYWNFADVKDYQKFPADTIHSDGSQGYLFTKQQDVDFPLPVSYMDDENPDLETFLGNNNTTAFSVIRNDSILSEYFFGRYNSTSILPSFSVAKVYVSTLVGIAFEEGDIKSLRQTVTDYLDGFKHSGFDKITIEDLLNMQSGIKFSEGYYNPFGEMARFYYGKNLKHYVYHLKTERPPGETYEYQSANTQILAMILEKATGKSLPVYLEEKIWKPLPMHYNASWNYDSRAHHNTKAFCCINARLYDYARFAKLFLNDGRWKGQQIIPSSWVGRILNAQPAFTDDSGYPYCFHWRVMENGAIFAKGILGQYIYIRPDKNIIILRFGEKSGNVEWPRLFNAIADQL
ncbi:MAG: beta-lactamase family protein [Bacteroidales bacterium]|nr:beta-lactamase family protein [Bacteroidales bacterium]MCF8344408.1 beta-lactamase family protein [Bacteroidales bacterium]MCF8349620.1 beta-lactamase family protein [Bacteroidales bacterium]MCF8376061.1 beta-lactamase family protein [Bacteroidales bacterium]MCF8400406.1 beta-lactamase family protein [Bacteroidales bacterium]